MEPQIFNLNAFAVDNTTAGKTCQDYFSSQNQTFNTDEDFSMYAEMTRTFRESNASDKVGAHFFTSGYILRKEDIDKLTPSGTNGIKFYLGIGDDEDGNKIVRLVAVGTFQEDSDHMFSDFGIPKEGESAIASITLLVEPRPCPRQCGKANILNPDPE